MNTLTCVYCGLEYPEGTPSWGSPLLTEHIKICEKHPMRQVEERNRALQSLLDEAKDIFLYLKDQTFEVKKKNDGPCFHPDGPKPIITYEPTYYAKEAHAWLKKYLKVNDLKSTKLGERLNG